MKIVDKMKDDELGLALLFNFTKGYGQPVPLEYYDIVLPLLYHDYFREEVLKHQTLQECLQVCVSHEEHFKENLLTSIEDYKSMTSKALGMAMIQHILSFQIINQNMCGVALESTILDLNEAIHLGEMVQGMSMKDIMNLFKQKNQKIVILQAGSVGHDISLERFQSL